MDVRSICVKASDRLCLQCTEAGARAARDWTVVAVAGGHSRVAGCRTARGRARGGASEARARAARDWTAAAVGI